MTTKRYVRLAKFAEETGYTEKAARRKIEGGVFLEGMPRIRCAVCERLVERVEWEHELYSRQTRITVRCHGETETMRSDTMSLSYAQMEELKDQEGVAFETKRINP